MAYSRSACARAFSVTVAAIGVEALAFVVLALVLQAGLAYTFIAPLLSGLEVLESHVVLAFLFVCSVVLLPALCNLLLCSCSGPRTVYWEKVARLPQDASARVHSLLVAVFLATVCKVSASVRFELVTAYALAYMLAAISRIMSLDLLEAFCDAVAREAAIALTLYAIFPGFDATFGHMVRIAAHNAMGVVSRLTSMLQRR